MLLINVNCGYQYRLLILFVYFQYQMAVIKKSFESKLGF